MKTILQNKSQQELELLSKEELKSYIDNIQKSKTELDETLASSFVIAKYIYVAKLQWKELLHILSENPNLNLVWTLKNGKIQYFGFSKESQKNISIAQQKLSTNLQSNHNQYIYEILKSKYWDIVNYIEWTILPTQKLETNLNPQSTNTKKYQKPQNLAKIWKVMEMLDKLSQIKWFVIHNIYITREHDKNIMRQTDYIAIYITIDGIDKTILINDDYAESSFVIDKKLDKYDLTILDKWYYEWYELRYDKDESNWLNKFSDRILEKANDLKVDELSFSPKKKLNQEKYILHYKSIFGLEKYWWLLGLVKYSKPEIQKLKIDEKWVCAIATDIWFQISNKSNLPSPIWFRELLCYLYNVSDEELTKLLKLELINIFDSKEFWWIYKLAKYSTDQIRDIYINWLYIMKYSSILWFKMTWLNPLQFKLFLWYLYNIWQSDINLIFKNKLLEIFNSDEFWWIHKLAFYTKRDIKAIKINDQYIVSLASETWFIVDRDSNNVQHSWWFRKFILYLYDITEEDLQKIMKNKEKNDKIKYILYYKNIFDSEKFGGIKKLWLFDQIQVRGIKIDELWIIAIAKDIWRNYSDKENNPQSISWFRKMLCYIYDIAEEEPQKIINKNK